MTLKWLLVILLGVGSNLAADTSAPSANTNLTALPEVNVTARFCW